MKYSAITLHYFKNTSFAGQLATSESNVKVTRPQEANKGEQVRFYVVLKENKIHDLRFQAYGSVAAIACAQFASEYLHGKMTTAIKKITAPYLIQSLSLPKAREHSAILVQKALQEILSWEDSNGILRHITNLGILES